MLIGENEEKVVYCVMNKITNCNWDVPMEIGVIKHSLVYGCENGGNIGQNKALFKEFVKIGVYRGIFRCSDCPEDTLCVYGVCLDNTCNGDWNCPAGYVCIDVPSIKLLLSEPRMAAVDVRIIGKDGRTRWFREHTPVADALRKRQVSQNAMSVITLKGYEEAVSNIAERIIYS